MPVFYTLSNKIFYIKTPWKKLYSPRNSMNFFFSLSVLGLSASSTQNWISTNPAFWYERSSVISNPMKIVYFHQDK